MKNFINLAVGRRIRFVSCDNCTPLGANGRTSQCAVWLILKKKKGKRKKLKNVQCDLTSTHCVSQHISCGLYQQAAPPPPTPIRRGWRGDNYRKSQQFGHGLRLSSARGSRRLPSRLDGDVGAGGQGWKRLQLLRSVPESGSRNSPQSCPLGK